MKEWFKVLTNEHRAACGCAGRVQDGFACQFVHESRLVEHATQDVLGEFLRLCPLFCREGLAHSGQKRLIDLTFVHGKQLFMNEVLPFGSPLWVMRMESLFDLE